MRPLTILILFALFTLTITLSIIFSGCLGQASEIGCSAISDAHMQDECIQQAAVTENNPSLCENISGSGFTGSNPPKDKCYLRIANETGDASLCSKMKGGDYSYEPSECYYDIAVNTGDPSLCDNVPAWDGSYKTMNINKGMCLANAKASPNYDANATNAAVENKTITTNATSAGTNITTNATTSGTNGTTSGGTNVSTSKSTTTRQPATIKPAPTTEPAKTSAATDAGMKPADPSKISDKGAQIATNLPASAKSDVKSATIASSSATQTSGTVPEPTSSDKEQPEGYLSKAWNWITWSGGKAADVKEAAGEEAPIAGGLKTAGTVTEVIKDTSEISDSFNGVNDQIKSGAITQNQGKLLKVGYGLGKGIKWVAKNVPIVGDTVGDVADGAFQTGMKAGEKIAAHTTKTNKCIDDPLSDDCIN